MTKLKLMLSSLALVLFSIGAHAQDPNQGIHFKTKDLCGVWNYQDAFVELPGGGTTRNFGDHPRGYFIIDCDTGRYSHIVQADNLPVIASGMFKQMTDSEAQAVATNVLTHFGTWDTDTNKGQFTVKIIKSSFANFDGLEQVRVVQVLDKTTLQYKNLQVTTGPGAAVIAVLKRISPHKGKRHR